MKSICFFASYFRGPNIPYYTRVYLQELRKHYSEVIFLSSGGDLSLAGVDFLKKADIIWQPERNEGYDFGLWYNAFQKYDLTAYEQIALVNDSCILFKPLTDFINWSKKSNADFMGMTISEAISPHLQSYFLQINKPAIGYVKEYFEKHKLIRDLQEVIMTYEVGLSTFLLSKDIKMAAYMDNNGYKGEFAPYYQCVNYHLAKGIPLIKKKIIFSSYRKDEFFTLARMNFKIDAKFYIELIKKYNSDLIIDFGKLMSYAQRISTATCLKYEFNRRIISLVHLLNKAKN